MMVSQDDIILYHYPFSPYARKVVWYLTLAGIPYTQCLQPPYLPRPDLTLLNTSYRRIPLLSHGRDIYCDTRLILSHLSSLVPSSSPLALSSDPTLSTLRKLLEKWTVEILFARASQLIPPDNPFLKDEKFVKDREQLSGRSWSREDVLRSRPEALVHMREAFEVLEGLLGDGREWVNGKKGEGPGLADVEVIWPFHWLIELPGALPGPVISEKQYPRVWAYKQRFDKAIKAAKAQAPKVKIVKGDEAAGMIGGSKIWNSHSGVDRNDPLGLSEGEMVQVWPIDSGFTHKDTGALAALNKDEVVIVNKTEAGEDIRLHFPRINFRIKGGKGTPKL